MTETVIKIRPEDYLLFNLRPAREPSTQGYVTIAGEELSNLSLFSALRDFEQKGVFIVPHLL
jgi:hypothetical protein